MKNILWLMANLASFYNEEDQLYLNVERLCSLVKRHHEQFDFDLWRVFVWNMRLNANLLEYYEDIDKKVDNYFYFLKSFQ